MPEPISVYLIPYYIASRSLKMWVTYASMSYKYQLDCHWTSLKTMTEPLGTRGKGGGQEIKMCTKDGTSSKAQ